jgi:hypothetical protein
MEIPIENWNTILLPKKESTMFNEQVTTIGLVLICMAGFCATSQADDDRPTLVVGQPGTPCPNAQYSTIMAAISAAPAGAEIDICPALYPEQLIITKPLTLRGLSVNGVDRVLLQPALQNLAGLPFEAVINVLNTHDVTIQNLAIDASHNTVSGCAVNNAGVITNSLAGIHFYNASGSVENSAIFGAQLPSPGCLALFPGNGFSVQVDTDGKSPGPFQVSIGHNSIHDFGRNGILAVGSAVNAEIEGNAISGVGPSTGAKQFGIFLALGVVGRVTSNVISQGLCGTLSSLDCINLRSEGIVLRAVGDGTVLDRNIITNVQSGIFVNGGNAVKITNNLIKNVQALSGMDIQGTAAGHFTNSLIEGNTIVSVGPINSDASNNKEGCGINEYSGTGVLGNTFRNNTVNDAFCGIAFVTADNVESGAYFNTLYATLNADQYPNTFPPATEP